MTKTNFLKSKKIKLLKKYFEKEPSVLLVFVFGSFARGFWFKESDFDLAVYLKEKQKRRKIWFNAQRILEKEVDLVCLDEAPATLVSNIFKTGIPLVIKDKKLYWELFLKTSSEAMDFLKFTEDYWEIYKKAKSLIPEEKVKLIQRTQFLDSELKEIDRFEQLTFDEYCRDRSKKREIERWTENIINATIDIAKTVLASERKKMPKTYGDALYYFGNLVGLNEEESEKLAEFADLRNILAHEYLEVLFERIQSFIKEYPKFYKKIYNFFEKYLKK